MMEIRKDYSDEDHRLSQDYIWVLASELENWKLIFCC